MEKEIMSIVFVFYNNKTQMVKVLNLTDAKRYGDDLLKDGWVHTSTVDPCRYIEEFCNNDTIGRSTMISNLIELN